MSEKTIEGNGKAFLLLILPVSFLAIFLASTWRVWLGVFLLILGFNFWQRYQWRQWCLGVNPTFHQLIQKNQGSITPMDLAAVGNFSGDRAKYYLNTKANEFGANIRTTNDGNQTYYFMNATILGGILDSSEPQLELPAASVKSRMPLLTPPAKTTKVVEAKPELVTDVEDDSVEVVDTTEEGETLLPMHHSESTLAEQLVFGSLIQSELAKRLNVYSSTVFKRRDDADFPEWSKNRDPDGVSWRYDRKTREFFPVEESESVNS
ncbi:hypothetical protein [Calothrix sp. PCC 6303]|uniref:hypothetical protein n=1 Tax=Calothrix sp. PCC 6303 TaxID=1170562 RepID=UPI0002A04EF5|nr:hypothetical protein [Calothrix sp. PCC 6303]AFZ04214.1 hypothetical protein Cal6303_5331 [Calothrix sp. PCC 6303]